VSLVRSGVAQAEPISPEVQVNEGVARAATERYLELARAGDADAIAELYAEDAEFIPMPPAEGVYRGRQAIKAFYQSVSSGSRHPVYQSMHWVDDGLDCCLELHVLMSDPEEHLHVVDVVTATEDGHIARLAAYRRPTWE
jgi:hypothetical protein